MQRGFTLIEVIMTVVIMGMLASVAIPTYTRLSAESKIASSEADLEAIQKAFVNYYYETMLSGSKAFPPEPVNAGKFLNETWGKVEIPDGNGKTFVTLFSGGGIPLNPSNNPYIYILNPTLYPDGFTLKDPDYKVFLSFEP